MLLRIKTPDCFFVERDLLTARSFGVVLLTLLLGLAVGVIANSSPVSANACTVQTGSFITGSYYSNPNIAVIVPISAQCSFTGGQLSASGNAYEATTKANLGSSNTTLLSAVGSNTYEGQLVFTLSSSEEWHSVRVAISVYSGQSGSPILHTSETAAVDPNTKYVNYASCYTGTACDVIYDYCQSPNGNSTMQCVGYLYQNPNGCTELAIPIYSPYGFLSYQYYTLQNLPSSLPPIGSWAIATGQMHLGYNSAPNGAACPGNYLTVTSISP